LQWNGRPGSTLIAAVLSTNSAVYSINPQTAEATFIANAPTGVRDLAYRHGDAMYGTNGIDQLWKDTTGNGVPDTLVGNYGLGSGDPADGFAGDDGLAFDGDGNLLLHNLSTDKIYKGTGADPTTISEWVDVGYDSRFLVASTRRQR
jgi:hypothetical protein